MIIEYSPLATDGTFIEYTPRGNLRPKVAGSRACCTKVAGSTFGVTEVSPKGACSTGDG